jgi:hypothetical protein
MADSYSANFGAYLRAFTSHWFVFMSGPLSVPAAIAAVFVENLPAKLFFAATAVSCFIFSSYWIWKTEREDRLAAEAKIRAGVQRRPDWPIHELFSHINPDFLERRDDGVGDAWDIVGNDIRDQASLGHLKIWGRPSRDDGVDKLLGQREALRLIEPSYWTMAFFTYHFFDSTAGDAPHTYLEQGRSGIVYTDLRVNREESLSIWPKP